MKFFYCYSTISKHIDADRFTPIFTISHQWIRDMNGQMVGNTTHELPLRMPAKLTKDWKEFVNEHISIEAYAVISTHNRKARLIKLILPKALKLSEKSIDTVIFQTWFDWSQENIDQRTIYRDLY